MPDSRCVTHSALLYKALLGVLLGGLTMPTPAQTPIDNDIPAHFSPAKAHFDYERHEVMVPMRDGVKLLTVIWSPKRSALPMPIVLTRTPYDAAHRPSFTSRPNSPYAAAAVPPPDVPLLNNGYIRVYQDIRGQHGSEGAYTMTLPPRGPLNPGKTDQSTDAWDTIDWLVKNVPNNNGRVGITGVSYEGWTSLMALLEPHPALAAAIPMNPMVDGWLGDDWYHNGALRQMNQEYVYRQTTPQGTEQFSLGSRDTYSAYLQAGSAHAMAKARGADTLPAWQRMIDNPAYTEFWQQQAVDRLLAKAPLRVPTLTVHSLFDQEDIYGSIAAYHAMESQDTGNDRNFLVIGPWFHGQQDPWFHQYSGSHLGPLQWGSDTTATFLNDIVVPFFDTYLKGQKSRPAIAPVQAFETGSNLWHTYSSWPAPGVTPARLYLREGGKLSLEPGVDQGFTEYISDPGKPVPYRVPPILTSDAPGNTWSIWLIDDQRPFTSRPDVLSWISEPLQDPVTIAGNVTAALTASTSGTDSDWVVKLIDVYPEEYPQVELGGYQVMISADIFRGRYRKGFDTARPIEANKPLTYDVRLPNANHTFNRGHRIMVQVQSSWFPLYDRNPQTFVDNIAYAQPTAYRRATQRIYHASYVEIQARPALEKQP